MENTSLWMEAALENHVLTIEQLLLDCDNNSKGPINALYMSCREGHKNIIDLLLPRCMMNKDDLSGCLSVAVEKGHASIVAMLLHAMDPDPATLDYQLCISSMLRHQNVFDILYEVANPQKAWEKMSDNIFYDDEGRWMLRQRLEQDEQRARLKKALGHVPFCGVKKKM